MKTDRELLELAAKAAGVSAYWSTDGTIQARPLFVVSVISAIGAMPYEEEWNPLKNDGDALRLAVTLNMGVSIPVWKDNRIDVITFRDSRVNVIEKGNDAMAATRRAIVRAAAEIGAAAKKGTPQPQTQHNKTPQNVLITTDQKFTQTQQKQSKNKL